MFQQASARKGRAPNAKAKAVTSNIVSRGSELEQLKKLSHLVLETASVGASTFEELGPQAATVSPSVLLHTLHDNPTADVGALEGAMVYEPCDVDYTGSEDARLECVIDKAFVNLGGMMADRVGGLVSVEIVEDKATALSTEAIVAKARHMRAMFDEINVDASRCASSKALRRDARDIVFVFIIFHRSSCDARVDRGSTQRRDARCRAQSSRFAGDTAASSSMSCTRTTTVAMTSFRNSQTDCHRRRRTRRRTRAWITCGYRFWKRGRSAIAPRERWRRERI